MITVIMFEALGEHNPLLSDDRPYRYFTRRNHLEMAPAYYCEVSLLLEVIHGGFSNPLC